MRDKMTDLIMERIHKDDIKMRPKLYFVVMNSVLKFLLAGTFMAALFFANVVLFKFRIYDPFGFLVFGKSGLNALFGLIPMYIIFLVAISIIGFSYVIRFFDISYKRNYSGLIVGMFVLVVSGGFILDKTGVNELIKTSNSLPTLYYGRYTTDRWVMGEVKEISYDKKVMVLTIPFNLGERIVAWDDSTLFPKDETISKGVYIKVIGSQDKNFFKAEGIVSSRSPINH